jgi:uncharacterized YccA/Bax inhibitor family protein
MFRGSNPALRDDVFAPAETLATTGRQGELAAERPLTMTVNGVFNKSAILLGLCIAAAIFAWSLVLPTSGGVIVASKVNPWTLIIGGAITGLILALITSFKPTAAPITAPLYALAEGVFIGAISAVFALMLGTNDAGALTPNYAIVFQAAALTFGVLAVMLALYRSGIIKVTRGFRTAVVAAMGAIMLVYIASFLMNMFMGSPMPYLHSSGPIGIGISVVIVVVAALTLPLTFDFISRGVAAGAPRSMEWYAGFSLLVSLVWLYLEILVLLAKLQGRE